MSTIKIMAKLEWHDFGLKKASKNSIVYPTLKTRFSLECVGKNKIWTSYSESTSNFASIDVYGYMIHIEFAHVL